MTVASAIYEFMNGFGLTAYAATSVPDDAEFPYLTYDLSIADFNDPDVSIAVNLWYRGESEKEPNDKAEEIRQYIGQGGVRLVSDNRLIWIKRGFPFVQSMGDPSDNKIKRRYILLDVSYC